MKDNFDVDEFIMQGQIQIIDKIKDFYYDELPDGWSQHFVDEIRYFDDGFYTIRYYHDTPVIYHFFVDTESRGKGVATRQLKKMHNDGFTVFFDINDALDSVMGKLEEDEGIFFTDILYGDVLKMKKDEIYERLDKCETIDELAVEAQKILNEIKGDDYL